MSKHQKIMSSFETSLVLDPSRHDDSTGLVQMQDSIYQEDNRLRLIKSEEEDPYDLGTEGNKSTYLRPSRNRDMSSLIMDGKSRTSTSLVPT
jgi:hypothetical protein